MLASFNKSNQIVPLRNCLMAALNEESTGKSFHKLHFKYI